MSQRRIPSNDLIDSLSRSGQTKCGDLDFCENKNAFKLADHESVRFGWVITGFFFACGGWGPGV